jgi:hypothetical protein
MECKPFIMEYSVDYEGYEHLDVDIKDMDFYESSIKQLAAGECSIIVYLEPSVESLGADGYAIYEKEKARLDDISVKRRIAALKGVETRRFRAAMKALQK